MSSSPRSLRAIAAPRRPTGPRCHGGASSLLRLGFGATPQRVTTPRAGNWREIVADDPATQVEHIVGLPGRAPRAPSLSS